MGIYKRKDSKFYWMQLNMNGRRYRQATDETSKMKAQALYERWASELREKIKKGEPVTVKAKPEPEKPRVFFNELCGRYLEWCEGRQKGHTRKKYIVPKFKLFFGNKPLSSFSYALVESYQSDLISRSYSPAYINKNITVLKHMFHKALDWELIDETQYKKILKIKQLKGENKRLRYLSDDEADRLIRCCEQNLKPIVVTALNTGLRRGEILGLTWDRVDLKNRLILLDKTKNDERREVPISATLYEVLAGLVRNIKTDYVFCNPQTLKPYHDNGLTGAFSRAVKRAKLVDFHFHDLRHSFASKLVRAGVPLLTVSKLLGHKDIKMTLRYAHLSPDVFKEAISVLDNLPRFCHGQDELESAGTGKAL